MNTRLNPVYLNRNDAEGDRGIWTQDEIFGKWRVSVAEGTYNIRCRFLNPLEKGGQMIIETGTFINQKANLLEGITELEMNNISYPEMDCDIIPFYLTGSKRIFPFYVEIKRVD
jgi:arylsulfatase